MKDVRQMFPKVKNKIFNRSHIALTMLKKGYVKTYKEAFHKYLKEHGCCYVAGKKFTIKETINAIHAAKGKAILAHPFLLKKNNLLEKLLEMDFDGIEVYYSYNPPRKVPKLKKQLILTGGSDFHGEARPAATIGCSLTPEKQLKALLA